jgi:hypothetical protein
MDLFDELYEHKETIEHGLMQLRVFVSNIWEIESEERYRLVSLIINIQSELYQMGQVMNTIKYEDEQET